MSSKEKKQDLRQDVSVNLLDDRRKRVMIVAVRAQRWLRYVVLANVGLGVALLVAFGINYWMSGRLDSAEEMVSSKQAELLTYEDVAEESQGLAKRLESVRVILEGRELLEEKVDLVFDLFSRGIDVSLVDFGGVDSRDELDVGGGVVGVSEFVEFNKGLNDLARERGYSQVELETLARGSPGDYQFSYRISLGDK